MKKKALIIVDHGSKLNEANEMLIDIADLIKNKNNSEFEIIAYCHMELAEPTISQAFDDCVSRGADHIVVHPYFLAPGRHSTQDIPRMVMDAAANHPEVSYKVTEPLGIHDNIIEVILERSRI
ncbi:MAG: CbiX/SirB N-terminal domain-containing protein [Thermodesulfobacteriota bacterium]